MVRLATAALAGVILATGAIPVSAGDSGDFGDPYFAKRRCWGAHGYCDPYEYRYTPKSYYPYYNSGYWPPAWAYRRPRYRHYRVPYQEAWGYDSWSEAPPPRRHRKRAWRRLK